MEVEGDNYVPWTGNAKSVGQRTTRTMHPTDGRTESIVHSLRTNVLEFGEKKGLIRRPNFLIRYLMYEC